MSYLVHKEKKQKNLATTLKTIVQEFAFYQFKNSRIRTNLKKNGTNLTFYTFKFLHIKGMHFCAK